MKNHGKILKMVLAALFMALAYVLPYLTGQIPEIGQMLCPMHLPVLLCGFFCGPVWAAFLAGAVTNAIPGIILQLLLVPVIVMLLDNPKIINLRD